MPYIWQNKNWPKFTWESNELLTLHGKVRYHQGAFLEKISSLGFDLSRHTHADTVTAEVVNTSALEGENLSVESVRSSVGHKLGLPAGGLKYQRNQKVDGMVEILLDATMQYHLPLSKERLYGWQAALFPTGYSGMVPITTGQWRKNVEKPMQVVSGPYGKEIVHFEAPPATVLDQEMEKFISWFNSCSDMDGILRAGLAHLWFITLHPFDDGNGRLARVITDMVLAIDESNHQRFFSFSSQIIADRENYYDTLKAVQKGNLDITDWLKWFLESMEAAIFNSEKMLSSTMAKSRFWNHFAQAGFNGRQNKVLNKLLDAGPGGFDGGLKNKKYVGMTKTSRATAQRELANLVGKGALVQLPGGGRSTSYVIDWDRWIAAPEEDQDQDNGMRV